MIAWQEVLGEKHVSKLNFSAYFSSLSFKILVGLRRAKSVTEVAGTSLTTTFISNLENIYTGNLLLLSLVPLKT